MTAEPKEDNIASTTTSIYYDSSAKLIWEIEGFDHAAFTSRSMLSDSLKVKCDRMDNTLDWKIQLEFRRENDQDTFVEVSLYLQPPSIELSVDCSFDISLGEPGLERITQTGHDQYFARMITPRVRGRPVGSRYMEVDPPKTMFSIPLDTLTAQREKIYPQGILRVTVDLRMCMKESNREGVREFCPALVEPSSLRNSWVASLYNNKKYSDVTIRCQDREFDVHKCILGQSSVFTAMLEVGLEETRSNKIVISDVEPEVFEMFLKSLYGETFEVPTDHTELLELLNCAEKYDLKALKIACLQKMPLMITLENAGELTVAADRYCEDEEFRKFFRNFCHKWQSVLLKNPDYKKLFASNLEAFI